MVGDNAGAGVTELTCPCCGKEFEGNYLPVEWLPLAVSGSTAQLIVKALKRGVGHWMDAEHLADLVYGGACMDDAAQAIRVNIHRMRPALSRAGWSIEGKNKSGYRLVPS